MVDLAYQHIADVHPLDIRRSLDRRGGWFRPQRGSIGDRFGRVFRGSAPANLAVPPSAYTGGTTIKIG
jgi:Rieske Fe-S protein